MSVYEPSHEKTNNLGFLPGLTNICLYSPRFKKLENSIYQEKGFYYSRTEKKGADQLYSYCTPDLCLWFHICRLLVF